MVVKIKAGVMVCLIIAFLCSTGIVYGKEKTSITQQKGGISESGRNSIIYSAGGGGHSLKNRLVLGGEGYSSFGPHNAGGYGFFDIGYAPVITGTVVIYPLVGIGGGAMTRDADDSVSKCALLNPSLGFDYLLYRKDRSGVLLGLRAGYTFTIYSNTWNWSMPYIRLVIGGFGFEK